MGFIIGAYGSSYGRTKKPFNPLLGETFELVNNELEYKFLAEQVSHHPPISASYTFSPNFTFTSLNDGMPVFKGTHIEIKPTASVIIELKNSKDYYYHNRCNSSLHNLIFGDLYLDHHGEIKIINHSTGDIGFLTLKPRGWTEADRFVVEG